MSVIKGTVVVTGANGSLGSAITKQLASQPEYSGYRGLFVVRDVTKADALKPVLTNTPHPNDPISLDLCNLDKVRRTAETINKHVKTREIPSTQTLVLNAGVNDFGKQFWTKDGLDVTFCANYLGHWLWTLLLLNSINKDLGRIVVLRSQPHDPDGERNAKTHAFEEEKYKASMDDEARFDTIAKGTWSSAQEDPSLGGFRRYGASKLFIIIMIHELQC
ncbi:hypothetical protein F4811DRAFT_571426 [Daldinia bambusicola]|nr:hypothetical protein F4811DRAFT_571426 [Daldinia bambusicola]